MKSSDIIAEVESILRARWQLDPARTVPELERVKLRGNHGVQIEGAVLYADMADSTKLVDTFRAEFAAEIYKSYLYGACKVIGAEAGEVTAFDGDRVMGVFVGQLKNTNAVKCALKINYLVRQINGAIAAQYPNTSYKLAHKIGIDTSKLLVAKAGVRDNNDLVWVGPAANYAAKMAALSESGFPTYISEATYNMLNESAKLGGTNKASMWEKRTWTATGKTVYRSSYWWPF
jgi:class 3 adenylate cyclase